MKRISRNYVDFLESTVRSLLAEREKTGKGDFDGFERLDLDRGPEDKPEIFIPYNVKELMTKTYKDFAENGWQ